MIYPPLFFCAGVAVGALEASVLSFALSSWDMGLLALLIALALITQRCYPGLLGFSGGLAATRWVMSRPSAGLYYTALALSAGLYWYLDRYTLQQRTLLASLLKGVAVALVYAAVWRLGAMLLSTRLTVAPSSLLIQLGVLLVALALYGLCSPRSRYSTLR